MAEFATVALLMLALAGAGIAAVKVGLPSPLGYLAAGLAFAAIAPGALPLHAIEISAELGVLVLLFFIGLELDLKRLRDAIRSTALTMPFDIAVPTLAIAAVARLMGWGFHEALALGMALAVSSTLFGERLTAGIGTPRGTRQRVLGVLVSEDVAAAGLIALLVVLAGGSGAGWIGPLAAIGKLMFFLVLMTAGAVLVVPRLLDEVARKHMPDLIVLWAVGLVALFGYLGVLAGSPELGGFVAGVAAAEAGSRYVVRNNLGGIRDIAAALFFLASGLVVDVTALLGVAAIAAAVALVFAISKIFVHVPGAIGSGLGLRASLHTGIALATVGEFSLILTTVAEKEGLAHPLMRTVAVGTMLILLPIAAVMSGQTSRIESAIWRLPKRITRPLHWLGQGLRRGNGKTATDLQGRRRALRMLLANLLLLTAWVLLALWLERKVTLPLPPVPYLAPAVWVGITIALAMPLLLGAYRSYRAFVWAMVGLRKGERRGAGKVRARLIDTWVALSAFLILVLAALRFPQTVPVLAGGAVIAMIVAGLAWQGLSRFHRTLESTLARVLGEEQESKRFLDQVLDRYPWGVRFTAVVIPPGSPVAGQTILDSRIAGLTGAMVAVLQRGRKETVNPESGERLRPGDTLVLVGDAHQLARAEALVVSHGDAIRMSAQSLTAEVEEVEVHESSPWVGRSLAETDIRRETGTLVVGVWRQDTQHPSPYRQELTIEPGTRLILLGTPLQLQRARLLAHGIPEAPPDED